MTWKYCPLCESLQDTKAIPFPAGVIFKNDERNWFFDGASKVTKKPELQVYCFIRNLKCLSCGHTWKTLEFSSKTCHLLLEEIKNQEAIKTANNITIDDYKKQIAELEAKISELTEENKMVNYLKQNMAIIHNCSKPKIKPD